MGKTIRTRAPLGLHRSMAGAPSGPLGAGLKSPKSIQVQKGTRDDGEVTRTDEMA